MSEADSSVNSFLKKHSSAPLTYCQPVNKDFSNWPHNEIEDEYLLSKQWFLIINLNIYQGIRNINYYNKNADAILL